MKLRLTVLFLAFCFTSICVRAQIKLPKLVSDGMVLQRDTQTKIWGWAANNETVSIHFLNSTYQTTANNQGEWSIDLPAQKAGGPYTIHLEASNKITISNILFGDVWLCSGQSNMAFEMKKVAKKYKEDVTTSRNSEIRQFFVPHKYNFQSEQDDISSGTWVEANPKTVGNFSAVAYFFARELNEKLNIPIGLINSSIGGTPAQAWTSEKAIKKFPHYYNELHELKNQEYIDRIAQKNKTLQSEWVAKSVQLDQGLKELHWASTTLDDSDWNTLLAPRKFGKPNLANTQGIIWYRKKVELKNVDPKANIFLKLGRISDADSVFVNEHFIGATSHQFAVRDYKIPSEFLKDGENLIAIRNANYRFAGGFLKGYPMILQIGEDKIPLNNEWKYKLSTKLEALPRPVQLTWKPSGLYNAMIAPLTSYKIKGAIWYQGEGNARAPKEYETLFSTMITDWRTNFNQGDFPFLFVQLANWQKAVETPSNSGWAGVREAQRLTLNLPNTGMAVTLDIGDANDIHPLNKKDVGNRLALNAFSKVYGNTDIVYQGPMYESLKIKEKKAIISFDTQGSNMIFKGEGAHQNFAIAGADKKFVWAKTKIEGNKVILWHPEISNPVAVRYAWATNPAGTKLFNSEGLPASSFRTDNW